MEASLYAILYNSVATIWAAVASGVAFVDSDTTAAHQTTVLVSGMYTRKQQQTINIFVNIFANAL